MLYLKDQAKQVAGTTLEFGLADTCGWRIIADTQYVADRIIKVKIESVYSAQCYITNSASADIKKASPETGCNQGTEYTFDGD